MELYETIPVRVRAKKYTQEMQDSFIAQCKQPMQGLILSVVNVYFDFIEYDNFWFNWLNNELLVYIDGNFKFAIKVGDYIVQDSKGEVYSIGEAVFLEKYKKILDLEKIGKKVDEALDNITPKDIIQYFPSVAENELNSKEDAHSKSLIALREYMANMTPEQRAEMQEHFRDKRPKGWLSIEEHLPMMYAKDIEQGFSWFKVKFADGTESKSGVSDGNTWYYHAKEIKITHWFNK